MTKPRRRQAGEGTISEYATRAGTRYLIKYGYTKPDGCRAYALKRGYPTRKDAAADLRKRLREVEQGAHVAPSRTTVGQWCALWLDGLRKEPSTVASYRKNVRLHVVPYIGDVRLEQLTGARLTKLYRQLEDHGRVDGKGGLSAKTVRYVHTIIHAALKAAVRDGQVQVNAADKADPPSARAARAPEMRVWTPEQLRAFLAQREQAGDDLLAAWQLLAGTGMRRGEALALRWGDVDLDAGRLSVRRAAVLVKTKGEGERIIVGAPKTGRSRVVDLDPGTVAVLRARKALVGGLSLALARDGAYVLADLDGAVRHPERFSRRFVSAVTQARRALGDEELPSIRLHDLRHTHASIMLASGVPVKVVSERLGHASVTITLNTYTHLMPGMQAQAAQAFGALLYGATS